jgi:hypothetical protein
MSTVYLPVEPMEGSTSNEHAIAIDEQCWNLYRPASIQSPNDITRQLFPISIRPSDDMAAIVGETTEQVYISPEVDLTVLLSILPNVTDEEKALLTAYVEANKGGYVPFENLIPPSSVQLTEAEAIAEGWPDPNAPEE